MNMPRLQIQKVMAEFQKVIGLGYGSWCRVSSKERIGTLGVLRRLSEVST